MIAINASPRTLAAKLAERSPIAERYLRILHPPGSVFEVRLLDVSESNGRYSANDAGFFDDAATAAASAIRHDIQSAPRGVYVTINPVQPELLSRIRNRIRKVKRGESASDHHVVHRRWLFIDLDPVRAGKVTGIPATDAERAKCWDRAEDVHNWLLSDFGWHEPLQIDSGNGYYLLFPIDLPNNHESTALVGEVLAAIGAKWSDDDVEIDTTVCNPSRIARLLATGNRKGDFTTERPHRCCRNLIVPDYLEQGWCDPIPVEKLQAVAVLAPRSTFAGRSDRKLRGRHPARVTVAEPIGVADTAERNADEFGHRLTVESWLTDRGVEYRISHTLADGRECWQIPCPFNADHGYDAAVLQSPDGKTGFHCHHKSCANYGWQDAKAKIGKPDADHYAPPLSTGQSIVKAEHRTELANSQRFVKAFRTEVLYVPAQERFRIYDGRSWQEDVGRVGVMQRGK